MKNIETVDSERYTMHFLQEGQVRNLSYKAYEKNGYGTGNKNMLLCTLTEGMSDNFTHALVKERVHIPEGQEIICPKGGLVYVYGNSNGLNHALIYTARKL